MELEQAPAIDERTQINQLQREMPDVPRNTIRLVYRAASEYVRPSDDADALKLEVRRLLSGTMVG